MSPLELFRAEVTSRGGEACLPRNLSDEWLLTVSSSIHDLLVELEGAPEGLREASAEDSGAIALSALLSILFAKNGNRSLKISLGDIDRYLRAYRVELALELVHRGTNVKCDPATIESVLTARDVRTWRE